MKNTKQIPSGSLPLSEFIAQVCQNNTLVDSYFIMRSKVLISWKQAKQAFKMINS